MPAKSKAQQRLMQAAAHGADFPMAAKVRDTMSLGQMRDFSAGSMAGKPGHVKKPATARRNPIANLGHHAHQPKARR